MVLSELTNKELKGILRENNVSNYSKLNKKNLVKKVNQLIKAQNGGKNGKGKNGKEKKYTLKDFIGGNGGTPAAPASAKTAPAGATLANGITPLNAQGNTHEAPPASDTTADPADPAATVANPGFNPPPTVNKNSRALAPNAGPSHASATAPPLESNAPPRRVYMNNNGSINPSNTVQVHNPYLNPGYTPTNNTSTKNSAKKKNNSTDECGACSIQ